MKGEGGLFLTVCTTSMEEHLLVPETKQPESTGVWIGPHPVLDFNVRRGQ